MTTDSGWLGGCAGPKEATMTKLAMDDLDALDEVIASWQHSGRAWAPMRLADVSALIAEVRASRLDVSPAPRAEDGKPVLTEWREEDGQWARYVVGWPQQSMSDEAAQVQPCYEERGRFDWHVYAERGDCIDPIKSGREDTASAAQAAADLWIRANPDKVPYRLPDEHTDRGAGYTHHGTADECGCADRFPRAPRDEAEREACNPDLPASCPATQPYICTRQRGHAGDHVAALEVAHDGKPGKILARWPSSPPPAKPRELTEAPTLLDELRAMADEWEKPVGAYYRSGGEQRGMNECAADLRALIAKHSGGGK